MKVSEIAKKLGVHKQTIYRLIWERKLVPHLTKKPRTRWYEITEDQIKEMFELIEKEKQSRKVNKK
jgi:excisionase family DNA binding protein